MNNNVIVSITCAKIRNNYVSAIKYKYYLVSLILFLTYIKKELAAPSGAANYQLYKFRK